jgi:hypothetical protein
MRLRITKPRSGKNAPGLASTPPQLSRLRAPLATEPEIAAFGYLRERLFLTTAGPAVGTFGYPRHAPCSYRRATVSYF